MGIDLSKWLSAFLYWVSKEGGIFACSAFNFQSCYSGVYIDNCGLRKLSEILYSLTRCMSVFVWLTSMRYSTRNRLLLAFLLLAHFSGLLHWVTFLYIDSGRKYWLLVSIPPSIARCSNLALLRQKWANSHWDSNPLINIKYSQPLMSFYT